MFLTVRIYGCEYVQREVFNSSCCVTIFTVWDLVEDTGKKALAEHIKISSKKEVLAF